MNWKEYIHSDPSILMGKPTIKDTRLSVELIVELFELGWSKERILEGYPTLTDRNIKAVFAYIKDLLRGKSYSDIGENNLSQAHEPMVQYGVEEKPFDVRDYFGIITINMTDEELAHELNELRSEWDRDF